MVDTFPVQRDERTGGRRATRDDGSSLIEQLIAMSVIVAVLLGLLAALGATASSISTGRQRTVAVSLAKQAIENLQGAAYTDVAMNLSSEGLASDPLVSGTMPTLLFGTEPLVAGSSTQYRTTKHEAGTTFSLRTFVTAVTPASAGPYRRITLIIDWNTTDAANSPGQRTMQFSSLVFPLDYTSYPASTGSAEAIGGSVTLTGTLAGEQFEEVRLALPGTQAATDSSTLRTSIASAASSTSTVALHSGAVTLSCSDGTDRECPRKTAASVADNDTGTNTGPSEVVVLEPFSAASISTPKGTTVVTPAGTMTSRATVAACALCDFGDADELPWSEASLHTTSASSVVFRVDENLNGTLLHLDDSWSSSAAVDHDADGGGVVSASAQLTTPAARVFHLDPGTGVPTTFVGAVRVSGFTASASVKGGHTAVVPAATATASAATVEIWDGSLAVPGYRTVPVTPGTAADTTATAAFVVGGHDVAFTSRVQSQPTTTSFSGDSPRSRSVAQLPSLLLVTVDVTVTTGSVVETFTIVFDYGRVSAGTTWLQVAP